MAQKPTYEVLEQRIEELEKKLGEQGWRGPGLPQSEQNFRSIVGEGDKFRHIVEKANEAILVAQNGVFMLSNEKGESLFEYSKQELCSKPLTEFIHADDRELVKIRHEKRLRGETLPDVYSFRILTKSGTAKWVELKVALFSWEGMPATVCFFTDITRQKRAIERNEKLKILGERLLGNDTFKNKLNLITDEIVEIFKADFARIWVIEPGDICDSGCQYGKKTEGKEVCRNRERCLHLLASSGRYTHIDGGNRRVPLGRYKIGEIASKNNLKLLTNDVANDPHIQDHEWVKRLGLTSFAGYRILSATGKVHGVLALFSKHEISEDEDTQLENLAKTTSQVIQVALATQALHESEEKYRLIAKNATDVIWVLDPENQIFKYVSPSAERILGLTEKECQNRSVAQTVTPNSLKFIQRTTPVRIDRALQGDNRYYTDEIDVIHADGHIVPTEVNMRFVKNQKTGRVEGTGVLRDITERKRIEKEKEQLIVDLQKALNKVKLLGGLIPICSHCKSIRDDKGYWNRIEKYINLTPDGDLSHSICPECAIKYYPDMDLYDKK